MGPGGRWWLNYGTHSRVANSTASLVVIGSLERDEEGRAQAESAARKRSILRRRSARASSACAISTSTKRALDRKSTRLNSSHLVISYAVFCLKKKTRT